ncbi:hypothetical protein [Carboxylicivirga marina]|uniref:Outer membrane protein beta-barrel domain-containing protein n=1 Tax=Carboxylicivirga marina TaxID=2800988 RepID=A0ABS1HJK9_9BACT|nr:hypothetical protein [Carboxylicivirga marina]MBK3517650.1 hypothetical protein [Carboxylicivirga marina]
MRSVLIVIVLLCNCYLLSAQFSNSDWYISPKISFADFSDRHDWDGYSIKKVPPISIAAEKGLADFLSVGGLVGYSRDEYQNDTLAANVHIYSDLVLGGNANVHFAGWIEEWTDYKVFLGDWDFYAGLSLLFKWNRAEDNIYYPVGIDNIQTETSKSFDIKIRPLVGVRYFVTDNFCMLLEVGNGNIGVVTTGITFRIPQNNY